MATAMNFYYRLTTPVAPGAGIKVSADVLTDPNADPKDTIPEIYLQRVKVTWGPENEQTIVDDGASGLPVRLYAANGDAIERVEKPFFLEVAMGTVPGYSLVSLTGRNPEINSAAAEDVCDQGGIYQFPLAAGTLSVKSTNANDTSAGTGARTVKISGLDTNYDQITETVSLNGTTVVTTSQSFLRVFSAIVVTAGSTGSNEGAITVDKGADTLAQIQISYNRSLMAIYTVPRAKTGYLHGAFGNIFTSNGASGTKDGEFGIFVRPFGEVFRKERSVGIITVGNTFPNRSHTAFSPLPEKSDIKINFIAQQNNTTAIAGFDLIIKDN